MLLISVNHTTIGRLFALYIKNKKMINKMRAKKVKIDLRPKIKIQVDNRTMITVRSMDAFRAWKERYPDAMIIE